MSRDDPQMKIRLPADLKESIDVASKANNRTMNAEIVARLEQSFSAGGSDEMLKSLALRLAETEFNLRMADVESVGHLMDAHFASECALDAVAFNKAMGYEAPLEEEDLMAVQMMYRDAQAVLDDQTKSDLENAIEEMRTAHKRLLALKPKQPSVRSSKRKAVKK